MPHRAHRTLRTRRVHRTLRSPLERICAAVVLFAFMALPASAAIDRFTPFGPPGAALGVQAILPDPFDPQTVYAAAGADFYRSHDGGDSWTRLVQISFLQIAAARTGTATTVLYGATASQLLRSADAGHTWSPVFDLPLKDQGGPVFFALASLPGRLFVAAGQDVFRSDDGGDSWALVYDGHQTVAGLVADPRSADRVVLLAGGRVLATADAGSTWSPGVVPLLSGSSASAQRLAEAPSAPRILYVAGQQALCRSANSGASFTCDAAPFTASDIAVDPRSPATVYAADPRGGVSVTDDGGVTWSRLRAGLPPSLDSDPVSTVAVDPGTGGLYAGTPDRGVQRLRGRTWVPTSEAGLLTGQVAWMQFRPGDPEEVDLQLFAFSPVSYPDLLERSRDGGRTWTAFGGAAKGLPTIEGLAFEPSNPAVLYAWDGNRLFRSGDDGATWSVVGPQGIQTAVSAGARTLLAGGCGVRRSTDLGNHFQETLACLVSTDPVQGALVRSVPQLVADPLHPATVYAVAFEGFEPEEPHNPPPTTAHLYKTTDGGASWHPLPAGASILALAPSRPETLYGVLGTALLRSDDGGRTFRTAGTLPGIVTSLAVDARDPEVLYVSGSDLDPNTLPLHRSTDGGASWQPVAAGLPRAGRQSLRAVVADPAVSGRVYVLPEIGGLFVADLTTP